MCGMHSHRILLKLRTSKDTKWIFMQVGIISSVVTSHTNNFHQNRDKSLPEVKKVPPFPNRYYIIIYNSVFRCLRKVSPLLAAVDRNGLLHQMGHQFYQYISSCIALLHIHSTTSLCWGSAPSSSNPAHSCLLAVWQEWWITTAAIPSVKLEVRDAAEHHCMTGIFS